MKTIKKEEKVRIQNPEMDYCHDKEGYIQSTEKVFQRVDEDGDFVDGGLHILETDLEDREHIRVNENEVEIDYELSNHAFHSTKPQTVTYKYKEDGYTVYVPELGHSVFLMKNDFKRI